MNPVPAYYKSQSGGAAVRILASHVVIINMTHAPGMTEYIITNLQAEKVTDLIKNMLPATEADFKTKARELAEFNEKLIKKLEMNN